MRRPFTPDMLVALDVLTDVPQTAQQLKRAFALKLAFDPGIPAELYLTEETMRGLLDQGLAERVILPGAQSFAPQNQGWILTEAGRAARDDAS